MATWTLPPRPIFHLLYAVALPLLLCLPACDRQMPVLPDPVQGWVPADQAANQLGLRLTRSSRYSATMENGHNSVTFLGPPEAAVVLNGRRYVATNAILGGEDHLLFAPALIAEVRTALRQAPVHAQPTDQQAQTPAGPAQGKSLGVVVIDPGHGGKDPGAPNRYGPVEKVIVLDTARRVRDLLVARGVQVVMTRDDDSYPELDERVALANRVKPDLFVSIHADAAANTAANGFTVIIAGKPSSASVAAGNRMVLALSGVTESRGLRKDVRGLRVLEKTTCPAMLIELGFLTNAAEARRLSTAAYRQQLAVAVAAGIEQYLRSK